MSRENVEVVRRLIRAFNERDDQGIASMLAPDAEFESLTLQTYRGTTGLAEYRRNLDEAWAEWRLEADRFIPAGSELVVHLHRVRGRGRGSDIAIEQDIAIVWTLRTGHVTRGKAFLSQADALKVAGLAE
jgi:ketosteroid isomerase-like protein